MRSYRHGHDKGAIQPHEGKAALRGTLGRGVPSEPGQGALVADEERCPKAGAYPMTREKQLRGINIQAARLKRDSDQALNAKEFAVLAGISYSVAREWFHLSGFPAVRGMVFWGDFVLWRRTQNCPKSPRSSVPNENREPGNVELKSSSPRFDYQWPARAANILAEVH